MTENKGWWRVVVNNDDCPFKYTNNITIDQTLGTVTFTHYDACKLLKGQFNDECLYENCKKRY